MPTSEICRLTVVPTGWAHGAGSVPPSDGAGIARSTPPISAVGRHCAPAGTGDIVAAQRHSTRLAPASGEVKHVTRGQGRFDDAAQHKNYKRQPANVSGGSDALLVPPTSGCAVELCGSSWAGGGYTRHPARPLSPRCQTGAALLRDNHLPSSQRAYLCTCPQQHATAAASRCVAKEFA